MKKAIAHLNIIGFRSAVAALENHSLMGRPFVIAGGNGGRVLVWDVSPEAIRQNVKPGMALAAAQRLVKDLTVVAPNPAAYQKANGVIETIINRYAPAWQNDGCGNLYLDITGTRKLFGPPTDCLCHVQNEIIGSLCLRAAAATASNKLVSKVASRAIRPAGLIEVRPGNEAAFLAHQDISLLPGLGPSLMNTIRVTGFREAGELAALCDGEALSLFGKKGILLRDMARGIDNSPVSAERGSRVIEKRADFHEDVLDEMLVRCALAGLAEHGGFEMRKEKLGMRNVRLSIRYSDGVEITEIEKGKRPLVLDREILAAAYRVFQKSANRRIRVNSINLSLEDPVPLGYEPDLFEPEAESKNRKLQETADRIKSRYGAGKITKGTVLDVTKMSNEGF